MTVHSTFPFLTSVTSKVLAALCASSVAIPCIAAGRFKSEIGPWIAAVMLSYQPIFISVRTLPASKESSWNSWFKHVLLASAVLTDTCLPFNISSTDKAFTFFMYSFLCSSVHSNQHPLALEDGLQHLPVGIFHSVSTWPAWARLTHLDVFLQKYDVWIPV